MDGSARTLSAGERARCQFRANRLSRPPQCNSTRTDFNASMGRGQEDGMAYEWGEKRARRDRLWKVAAVLVVTLVTAGIPTAIVFAAMRY